MSKVVRSLVILVLVFLSPAFSMSGTSFDAPIETNSISNDGDGSTSLCPDKIYTEVRDVHFAARWSCTILLGGSAAVVTTVVCGISAGWGCFGAGGVTAGTVLGCSEIFVTEKHTFLVRDIYVYVNKVYQKGCQFHNRTSIRID